MKGALIVIAIAFAAALVAACGTPSDQDMVAEPTPQPEAQPEPEATPQPEPEPEPEPEPQPVVECFDDALISLEMVRRFPEQSVNECVLIEGEVVETDVLGGDVVLEVGELELIVVLNPEHQCLRGEPGRVLIGDFVALTGVYRGGAEDHIGLDGPLPSVSCFMPATPTNLPVIGTIGETVTGTALVNITSAEFASFLDYIDPSSGESTRRYALIENFYLLLDVEITGVEDEGYLEGSPKFKATDQDGTEYEPQIYRDLDLLGNVVLPAGQQLEGRAWFSLPNSVEEVQVRYDFGGDAKPEAAVWQLVKPDEIEVIPHALIRTVGEAAAVYGLTVSVESAEFTSSYEYTDTSLSVPAKALAEAPEGEEYLILDVEIFNSGEQSRLAGPKFFRTLDETQRPIAFQLGDFTDNPLEERSLDVGERMRGQVVFRITEEFLEDEETAIFIHYQFDPSVIPERNLVRTFAIVWALRGDFEEDWGCNSSLVCTQ